MASMEQTLREVVWPRRGVRGWVGWLALQPASALFAIGVALRNAGYRIGILRAKRAGIPVISVGNLSVGGTGKTPITLWLARQLASDGTRVAILLRGYAGDAREVTVVSEGNGPVVAVDLVGDEAAMLAKCFHGVVLTARQRLEGVARAQKLGCQVVVLDDGFQHRALARNFDLVLVNGRKGEVLPAGPMREPETALQRADAIAVVNKSEEPFAPQDGMRGKPTFRARLKPTAVLEPDGGVWHEQPVTVLGGRRVAAVCGIADPAPFYAALRRWEAQVIEVFEFPDHHRYTQADWQRLLRETRNVECIVTTEKDLVKLEHFPFARGKLLALRVVPEVEDGDALVAMIRRRAGLDAQEESHGNQ
ncbi:MAG TPA: tetraacyldisaccharide 4'-kinase [Candidatus Acidoferrales bacterium]|nr:tetraacyldisaccharide 4'-kinase [Candidatus Acidoferrales bacterium]